LRSFVDSGRLGKKSGEGFATLHLAGPFKLAEVIGYETLVERLEEAYEERKAELFKPVIRDVSQMPFNLNPHH